MMYYKTGDVTLANNFECRQGKFRTNGSNFNVTGTVTVYSGGDIDANNTASYSFNPTWGSLVINGGTYTAKESGTTTITNKNSSNYSLDNDGTFTHNSGTVIITGGVNSSVDLEGTGNYIT